MKVLIAAIMIALGVSAQPASKTIPVNVQTWLDNELAKAKYSTSSNPATDVFFVRDTARIIGYIAGYDPGEGFSTGVVFAGNRITREDCPVVVQIQEDGRFEGAIPMVHPEIMGVKFHRAWIQFYIQPGQTLAMSLDWDEFRTAEWKGNSDYKFSDIQFQGAPAQINKELTAFQAQLPTFPYGELYGQLSKKNYTEYKSFLNEVTADYSAQYKRLLDTETLSEKTRKLLQDSYNMEIAAFLFEYEMNYRDEHREEALPLDFYDFLQDIPMNDRELLSTPKFAIFINRFEYATPFMIKGQTLNPEKTFAQYLFEDLSIPKTPEDVLFIMKQDSLSIVHANPDMTEEEREKWLDDYDRIVLPNFLNRHGNDKMEAYTKKYINTLVWRFRWKNIEHADSVYLNVLKLKPCIVYDLKKVRLLNSLFSNVKDQPLEARAFLSSLEEGISEPFLKEEAERLYYKNFPVEKPLAYELPDTKGAEIFKKLIAPHRGKILLVDFWATSCGPCIGNIKRHKPTREKYRNSADVDFVFITPDNLSPLKVYDKFVEEQELINSYRISSDDFLYLRQLFRFNGIPRYVIVEKDGRIRDDNADCNGFQ
jgi:thiol-disulfide isomerase/thioredoxin